MTILWTLKYKKTLTLEDVFHLFEFSSVLTIFFSNFATEPCHLISSLIFYLSHTFMILLYAFFQNFQKIYLILF